MGRPAARYSNSLSGDVYRSEIRVAVFGRTEHVRGREIPGDGSRFDHARELHALGYRQVRRAVLQTTQILFHRVAADDQSLDAGQTGKGLEQDVHALPRIQMSGICHHRRTGRRRSDERPRSRQTHAIRDDHERRPIAEAVRHSAASARVIVMYPSAPCHTRDSRAASLASLDRLGDCALPSSCGSAPLTAGV